MYRKHNFVKMLHSKSFKYFDSHCHINGILQKMKLEPNFSFDSLSSNWPKGFDGCISIPLENVSQFDTFFKVRHPKVFYAVGLHPLFIKQYNKEYEDKLINHFLTDPRVRAIGEIGFDRYKGESTIDLQKKYFIRQIEISNQIYQKNINSNNFEKRTMPIVIHTRRADEDTYDVLKNFVPHDKIMHIHCFSGSLSFCENVLANWKNAFFGITGKILYKEDVSKHIKDIVKYVPIERILAETDSPFLMPPQLKQEFSTPALIPSIIKEIASVKGINEEFAFNKIRENCRYVYGV